MRRIKRKDEQGLKTMGRARHLKLRAEEQTRRIKGEKAPQIHLVDIGSLTDCRRKSSPSKKLRQRGGTMAGRNEKRRGTCLNGLRPFYFGQEGQAGGEAAFDYARPGKGPLSDHRNKLLGEGKVTQLQD